MAKARMVPRCLDDWLATFSRSNLQAASCVWEKYESVFKVGPNRDASSRLSCLIYTVRTYKMNIGETMSRSPNVRCAIRIETGLDTTSCHLYAPSKYFYNHLLSYVFTTLSRVGFESECTQVHVGQCAQNMHVGRDASCISM